MLKLHHLFPVIWLVLLAACQPLDIASSQSADETTTAAEPAPLEQVDIGVGFIPNVQFAPFYVAQAKGFFAEEGLDVALEYGFENDFVLLTAQGERQFAVASGDQVILARAQGLPLVYVAKWYDRFPVGVMALAETGIEAPTDLAGQSVGIPGLFGASFIAWKALAYAADLDEAAVQLEEIGFTQAEAVREKKVNAAVVYLVNEPVQLREAGMTVNIIEVSEYVNLVANGLVTNEALIAENPDLVRRVSQGFLKGLQYTIDHPDEAFEIVRQVIPEMTDDDAPIQREVLTQVINFWKTDQPGLSTAEAWQESVDLMLTTGLIETPIDADSLYSNQFVE